MSGAAATRELSSLPGPRGLPLVGNMFELEPERFHLILEAWAREHGDLYAFRLLRRKILVLSNPEIIQRLLRERPHEFRRGHRVKDVIDETGGTGVFSAEGADWTRQRKLVMAAFNATHVRAFHATVALITRRLEQRWRAAAQQRTPVDVVADLMRYTVDVTTNVAFGQDMNTLERGEGELQQHLARFFATVNRRIQAPFPIWRYFKSADDRTFERSRAEVEKVVFAIIREARATLAADPSRAAAPSNLLEAMLVAHDADDPKARLSDQDIYGNVLTLLLAGEDTTALTIAWMLHYLATYPQVHRRMRAEVEALLGERDLPSDHEQIQALKYTAAVARETLRLRSVAPLMFLEPLVDTTIAELPVPAGSTIALLLRNAAMHAEHFGEPDKFMPERWLDDERPATLAHDPRAAFAFGSGPRTCPGRALALLECSMVAAMVVRNFELDLVDTGQPVAERFDFTMRPVNLQVRFGLSGSATPEV